jgi:hypothetical protein
MILIVILIAIAMPVSRVESQSIQVLSYSPGSTITYTGHGTPSSTTSIMISSSAQAVMSGSDYQLQLSDINVPACTITISVHPIQTITFGGSQYIGLGIWTPEITDAFTPSGDTGAYTKALGGGRYNARVFGTAASGATSVTVDVYVSQQVPVDSSGTYSATVDTANMPSGLYYLSENGNVVARIYLGIAAPQSYTLDLHQGWNLFSLPVQPEDGRISYIFSADQQRNIDVIWDYNGGNWQYWTTEEPWNQNNPLKSLDPRTGYWIYCYNAMSVTIYGSSPPPVKTWDELVSGWNCVGYPSTSSTSVSGLWGPADVVWKYNAGQWTYYTTEPDYASSSTVSNLEPGYGYWVYKL